MGWGRTLLLGDIGNRLDIEDTERNIQELRRDMIDNYDTNMSQEEKIEVLISENAELKLYLASLVRLMVSKEMITPGELLAFVEKVDAADGEVDGKFDGEIV